MGGRNSRRRQPTTPIPNYAAGGASPGITRPNMPVIPGSPPMNANQPQNLAQAQQMIANLNQQINALQRNASAPMGIPPGPYGAYPGGGYPPPAPYSTPPGMGYGTPPGMGYGTPPYGPGGMPPPYPYPPPMMGAGMGGGLGAAAGGYRDTDFGAVANIAGLSPGDVALLHREFVNLTRGGTNKIDRTVFRQILRDVLLEANNEHVDRAIENMFVTIDRNRDGYIDFPEFVGAFKDVLKGHISDGPSYLQDHPYPDILSDQLRAAGVGSGIAAQPVSYLQQAAPATQLVSAGGLSVVPLASTAVQQTPMICTPAATMPLIDAAAPVLSLDPAQSSYVIATPGQYMITQPTALQCVPLPIM